MDKIEEALKTLEVLEETISPLLEPVLVEYEDDLSDRITANYFALKQTLLKVQEQKKVLDVIWEKPRQIGITITYLKTTFNPTYEDYCLTVKEEYQVTQKEFDTLKEWVRNRWKKKIKT